MSGKLTWSHWYEMLSINGTNKITYYAQQCELYNLDVRKLSKKIKSNEYEKLPNETIGIIICKKDNKFIIEYLSDKRILSK